MARIKTSRSSLTVQQMCSLQPGLRALRWVKDTLRRVNWQRQFLAITREGPYLRAHS